MGISKIFHLLVIIGLYAGANATYEWSDDNFQYVIETAKEYTWDDAKAKCETAGMKLSEVKTLADFDSIKLLIDAAVIAEVKPEDCTKAADSDECEQENLCRGHDFWVGGKRIVTGDAGATNAFKWESTNEDVDQSAFIWAKEQPDNKGGSQNCLDLYFKPTKKVLHMYDDACSDKYGYICQAKK